MQAEDLQPTDDPLIRRGKRHRAYTERTCAGCHQPMPMPLLNEIQLVVAKEARRRAAALAG